MIRTFFDNKYILSYCVTSKVLQLHTIEMLEKPPPPPKKVIVEEVASPRGKKSAIRKKASSAAVADAKKEEAEKPADAADQEDGEPKPVDFLGKFKTGLGKKISAFTGDEEDLIKVES